MIEDGGVQPQGCIYELCSDISKNFGDMRSGFGYKLYTPCLHIILPDYRIEKR